MLLLQVSGLLKIKSLCLLQLFVLRTVCDQLLLFSSFQINDLSVCVILLVCFLGSGKTLAFAIPMIHSVLQWQKSNSSTTRNDSVSKESHQHHDETRWEDEDEAEKLIHQQVEDSGDEDDVSFTTGCVKVLENFEFDCDDETHTVSSHKKRPLLGLVLTPTRELAVQVKHHIDAVAKFTGMQTPRATSQVMLSLDLGIGVEPECVPQLLLHHKIGVDFEGLGFVVTDI